MTRPSPTRTHLPGESPRRVWRADGLFVDILPSLDLGNSSFVVGDLHSRQAVVIDATRDVGRYLDALRRSKLSLGWALDTHLHADFVSGGKQLADISGTRFGISAEVEAPFRHVALAEHQSIDLGPGHLTVLRTPGHTPEHISFLLHDAGGDPCVLFSGGSLMAGTAARPDLLGPRYTNSLVSAEYATLHATYRPLPGTVEVLPTHAGGSFCGVGARSVFASTLARERGSNPLFRAKNLAQFFVQYLSDTPFPSYYGEPRTANLAGGKPLDPEIPAVPSLAPSEVEQLRQKPGTTVLDIRPSRAFDTGHIPGALSVPSDGPVSAWVGWLRSSEESFVLVDTGPGVRRVVQIALLRIGYDGLRGYLDGGLDGYSAAGFPLATSGRVPMAAVRKRMESGQALTLLDVRNPSEAAVQHVPGSINIPLPRLEAEAHRALDPTLPVYVHCQSGYRAAIAGSILERIGFEGVVRVTDGPSGWAPTARSTPRSRRH